MKTKTALASSDPTFETQGPMGVFLSNQTDFGGENAILTPSTYSTGIYPIPSQVSLGYGPSGNPPPPWTAGTDWKVISADSTVGLTLLPNTFPVNFPNLAWWYASGSSCVMSVTDRSDNKVALGGQYVFDLPFMAGPGTTLSMHYTVSGVSGGSTVLPGFGLWNLNSNPGAWTYVAPTSFDGVWSLQLRSDDFLNYATLSVAYVNYSPMNMGPTMSRLFYSVSGNNSVTFPFPVISSQQINRPPMLPAKPAKHASRLHIVRGNQIVT